MSAEFLPVCDALGNFDQLDGRLVQRVRVRPNRLQSAYAFLTTILPFLDQALQHPADVKAIPAILKAEREVLEVDKDGKR